MERPFIDQEPYVAGNPRVREPQQEAFQVLTRVQLDEGESRELGIVLPVGCGKSGCIALAPFALRSRRALVIAPGVSIATQLLDDFNPSAGGMFYRKCEVLDGPVYPEPAEIRGSDTNRSDLEEAHVVITNIQQLQGEGNRWLSQLPPEFFDLILYDEGHHSVAESWSALKEKFPEAKIVNFSATPLRADGQVMAGKIIYSYPVAKAIVKGYVKRLTAVQLNPRTLRYVRREDGEEREVSLEEVKRLGEDDSDFRRSIVTSEETLATIVDASITALERLREETGENRLKIIASALNYQHCIQVVEAYRARGLRADYVHSREGSTTNQRVMGKLENHELDVIVQVRKLGEGFDHPYLSVAAVLSIFSNLSPFVQFVGRIMRVIKQDSPGDPVNTGVVVYHAGANIARRWADFQQFSEADQGYFDELLPIVQLDPSDPRASVTITPGTGPSDDMEVRAQSEVEVEEVPLLQDDEARAIQLLKERGRITEEFDPRNQVLEPVPVTKQALRRAKRQSLNARVANEAKKILVHRGVNPGSFSLDRNRLGRDNMQVMIAALHSAVNNFVQRSAGERADFTRAELDAIEGDWEKIVGIAITEVFHA